MRTEEKRYTVWRNGQWRCWVEVEDRKKGDDTEQGILMKKRRWNKKVVVGRKGKRDGRKRKDARERRKKGGRLKRRNGMRRGNKPTP